MNILSSWLREWIDPKVSDAVLAETLTMAGLEVDGITAVAPLFSKVVVGNVIACEKHPNADKLNLCKVDIGEPDVLQIVCGAKNVRTHLKVIVATVGAKLPNGLNIKKAKLRGTESFGMICSYAELGLSNLFEGIAELDNNAPIGKNIRQYLNLDDNIIELDITPNRGDCFSVLGVAREVSANYKLPLNLPRFDVEAQDLSVVNTSVSCTQACPKYLTRVVKNVDNTVTTPKWMADKLTRSGQALHSPVVDITNFVLLELGQPMHAFDLDKIRGKLEVRMANSGETIELLNDSEVTLKEDTLVVADEQSVLAIAGIMGGNSSATKPNSTTILLESAFFAPIFIAGKARDYGLHTESSLRFERGVDFNITETAMNRATQLIVEICGGQASKINHCVDVNTLPKLEPITITKHKIQTILGFELESNWIEEKFNNLNFEMIAKDDNSWTIIPPSFRFDIRIPADLIEELARLYGYDKLPVQKLALESNISTTPEAFVDKNRFANNLVNRGYQEVITYSFIAEKYQNLIDTDSAKIKLKNPISSDMSVMRSSLWPGLLQTLASNQRRGHLNARFFEIGLCFAGVKANEQLQKIAGIISGNRFADQWAATTTPLDFFDVKADVESLLSYNQKNYSFIAIEHSALQKGQSAKILDGEKTIGLLGALSPSVQKAFSLPTCYLFELDLNAIQWGEIAQYQALSAYQKSDRDIALMLDEDIPADTLVTNIRAMKQQYLTGVNIFDVYQGEKIVSGKKSIALSLSYQSFDGTLTDNEVNDYVQAVLNMVKQQYNAELR